MAAIKGPLSAIDSFIYLFIYLLLKRELWQQCQTRALQSMAIDAIVNY